MEANRFRKTPLASTYGDVVAMPSSITYAATAAGEVTDFFELPVGAELFELGIVNDALGASTTMSYGFRYKDPADGTADPDAFKADASATSAASLCLPIHPIVFDVPVIITGTLAGGAATGKVTITSKYRYLGTK